MQKKENQNEKLLFLDLDGTLLWPGTAEMPASAEEALKKARDNGHKAIICTGRNMAMIKPILHYGFDGIISSAGGYVQIGDEILCDISMPEEDRVQAFDLLPRYGIGIEPESFEHMYVDDYIYEVYEKLSEEQQDSELIRMRRQGDDAIGCLPLREYKGDKIYKILYLALSRSCFEIPEQLMGDRYFFLKHPEDKNGIIHGELINRKVGKGKALDLVTQFFGKKIEDTIAFGDSMNDAEMFEHAGYKVCMGNGPKQLKEMADYVCPSQEDDGIVRAFEKLGLI